MPYLEEVGFKIAGGSFHGVVSVPTVSTDSATGVEVVSAQPRSIEAAIEEAGKTIVTLTAGSPAEGFPPNMQQGRFYEFKSQPGTLYFVSGDNVVRALIGVTVS